MFMEILSKATNSQFKLIALQLQFQLINRLHSNQYIILR